MKKSGGCDMAIVVSHNEIISKERIIVTYHPIGKKKKIYSLFCLKKSGGWYTKPKSGDSIQAFQSQEKKEKKSYQSVRCMSSKEEKGRKGKFWKKVMQSNVDFMN